MTDLRKKYQRWKIKEFFIKWRLKAWNSVEKEKVRLYQKEVRSRYPPVCTNEELEGNPYGLLIPDVLMLENSRLQKKRAQLVDDNMCKRPPKLPLIRVEDVVLKPLEARFRR